MSLAGIVVGTGAALAVGRAARSLLFGLESTDPVVMLLATAVLASVALCAGYLPARRASAGASDGGPAVRIGVKRSCGS
jgi:hypothetical protein